MLYVEYDSFMYIITGAVCMDVTHRHWCCLYEYDSFMYISTGAVYWDDS